MTRIQGLWKVIVFVTLLIAALIYVVFFAAAPVSGSRSYPTPKITISAQDSSGVIPNIESFPGEKYWKGSLYPAQDLTDTLAKRYPRNKAVACSPATPVAFIFDNSKPETLEVKYVYVLEKTYDITKVSEEYVGTVYDGAFTLPAAEDALSDTMYIDVKATFEEGNYVHYYFAVALEK